MIFLSPYPDVDIPDMPLAEFVLRQADRLADKRALVDAGLGESLSYNGLCERVSEVASGLVHRGMGKGDVLAIYAPNSLEYVIALLAVASIGGIVSPVNALATPEELAKQLADADARFLLTAPELLAAARAATARHPVREMFVVGAGHGGLPVAELCGQHDPPPRVAIGPARDVVLLPYSSGTTGLPKGVMLTHRNVVANIRQANSPQRIHADEIVFCLPPFSHQYGLIVVARTLTAGATLVFSPRFAVTEFLRAIQEHRATCAYLAPPVVLALANDPAVEKFDLSSMRLIVSGAAPLSPDLIQRCRDRVGCLVIQGSGLTETSPITHLQSASDPRPVLGSIGPCLPNTECKVVDVETGAELGPGQQGEIWIRGPQVMKGYLNRPEATAAMIDADGWLHSGDLGCADAAGNFFIVDRIKELIKYKGYQVAPAELEAVLLSHPAVADAAVIPSPDDEAGEVPKACVVPRGNVSEDALIAFVAARVAPYKKVRRLEFVDRIPKSASGKILRRVLVERERAAAAVPVLV